MSYNDDNYNLDFNSHIAAEMCVEWIRDWFENNGNGYWNIWWKRLICCRSTLR